MFLWSSQSVHQDGHIWPGYVADLNIDKEMFARAPQSWCKVNLQKDQQYQKVAHWLAMQYIQYFGVLCPLEDSHGLESEED